MGEVYRARDTRLERDVAVKVLPEDLSRDPRFEERFRREARAISQLQHPNVCTLFDVGSEDGVDYLVMEYLPGEVLEERLGRGPLPVAETLRIATEIAAAIDAAHEQGIVHRDLKPGNVMLTRTGAKVLDFGLARETLTAAAVETQAQTVQAITQEGSLLGTMPYMAPELLEGQAASPQSDIWALGCILYEMATGERPFRGGSQASLISSIMSANPEPPSRKQALTPKGLDAITQRCLEKDPAQRWQSAGELAAGLESLNSSHPNPGQQGSRRRDVSVRLGVLAAAVVAIIGWALWPRPDLGPPPDEGGWEIQVGVLPFENDSGEPLLDQLAIGIADDVINRLVGVRQVATREASFALKDMTVCEAGNELGALVMLHGSVRRQSEDSVRVSAQYIRCPVGDHLWADSFDLAESDLPAAQDEVARIVAARSNGVLWTAERTTPGHPYWHLSQLSEEGNAQALRLFQAQAERDPADPLPHVGLYWTHMQRLSEGFFDEPPAVSIAAMEAAEEKCLGLRLSFWLCQQVVGDVARVNGETERMLAAAERVGELSGDLSLDFTTRALVLASRADDVMARLEPRVERNGSPDCCLLELASAHFAKGNYEEAARLARRFTLRRSDPSPTNTPAIGYLLLAASHGRLEEHELAQAALAEARKLRPKLSLERLAIWYASYEEDHLERYLDGLRKAGLTD